MPTKQHITSSFFQYLKKIHVDVLKANRILRVHMYPTSSVSYLYSHEIDKCELPTFYWLPNLHKNPYKSRFI